MDHQVEIPPQLAPQQAPDEVVHADRRRDRAEKGGAPVRDRGGGHAPAVDRHAQRQRDLPLRIGGEPDRLRCDGVAGVAGALHRCAPRRLGIDVEAEGTLIARWRLDIRHHQVVGPRAGRLDRKTRVAVRIDGAIGPHGFLESGLLLRSHVADERDQPQAGIALGHVEARQVGAEFVPIDLVGGGKETPQPDQQADVVLDPPVQHAHGLRDLVLELGLGLAADAFVGELPGGDREGKPHGQHEQRRARVPTVTQHPREQAVGLHPAPPAWIF